MKIIFIILCLFSFNLHFGQNVERFKLKKYEVAVLSDSLKESSGLNFLNENLYTFNDSGNSGELFKINQKTAKIESKINTQLRNIDWEAMANDGKSFFIGDFGNNSGSRKDLKVYKIPLNDSLIIDSIQTFKFNYPEQLDFEPKNLNTNFDAEAMVYSDSKIHIFTKEWQSKFTTHYTLDIATNKSQPARKIESFDTGYVVTDASLFEDKLYLIGYTKKTQVYLSVFTKSEGDQFFTNQPKKYYLGSTLSLSQIEGIAVNASGIYISGEHFKTPFGLKKGRLYFIPAAKFK